MKCMYTHIHTLVAYINNDGELRYNFDNLLQQENH
jgi:hypothetical protein